MEKHFACLLLSSRNKHFIKYLGGVILSVTANASYSAFKKLAYIALSDIFDL